MKEVQDQLKAKGLANMADQRTAMTAITAACSVSAVIKVQAGHQAACVHRCQHHCAVQNSYS
jgi:hypothetical protein